MWTPDVLGSQASPMRTGTIPRGLAEECTTTRSLRVGSRGEPGQPHRAQCNVERNAELKNSEEEMT